MTTYTITTAQNGFQTASLPMSSEMCVYGKTYAYHRAGE